MSDLKGSSSPGTLYVCVNPQSHVVVGGYPHESVVCTKGNYPEGENQCMGCQAGWPLREPKTER